MRPATRTKLGSPKRQVIAQRSEEIRAAWDEKEFARRLLRSIVQQSRLCQTLFGAH
jgi:hypothetical protein